MLAIPIAKMGPLNTDKQYRIMLLDSSSSLTMNTKTVEKFLIWLSENENHSYTESFFKLGNYRDLM